ncbi:MAG: putative lipoprotein [Ignavibacteria bacterium]|nr:putative lipoprotein [Ignavibacteria bacterium]
MRTLIIILLLTVLACRSNLNISKNREIKEMDFSPQFSPGPPAIVYKTKANYNNLVPVILSDDKTEIVSYPHPTDIKLGSGFSFPDTLNQGYLLDNRGIGINVAFLKLTYEEYSQLENAPTLKELIYLIIDKDPLIELCDCGNRKGFTNIIKQLNSIIDDNFLRSKCKVIK